MQGTLGEQVETFADAAARRRGGIVEDAHHAGHLAITQRLDAFLRPSPALLELGRFHGRGSSTHRLARFRVRVEHPPGGLAGSLVLHPHEPIV